jgi:hypothetical protein
MALNFGIIQVAFGGGSINDGEYARTFWTNGVKGSLLSTHMVDFRLRATGFTSERVRAFSKTFTVDTIELCRK